MDFIKAMMVLTGPLWLFLLLLPIAIWVAVKLSKKYAPGRFRLLAGIGIFLVVFFLPLADEFIGRLYLSYLCNTQAGVKVYQTVELPREYWDEAGRARFYVNYDSLLGKTYPMKYIPGSYSSFFNIDNAGYEFVDARSNQVLGEAIDFRYWGGWIRRNLNPGGPSATRCIDYSDPSNRLIDRIFIPEHSK